MTEQELPEGWTWGIGEKSSSYYDYWAYHTSNEYELHMWWDEGQGHSVELIPITGTDGYEDPIYGYAEEMSTFETEEEAEEYARELMENYPEE